jgi:hypothetical protein
MNEISPRTSGNLYTSGNLQRNGQMPEYLIEKNRDIPLFRWWYRIASPPAPPDDTPFRERARFLRGRTGSQILPALYLFLFASLPTGFLGLNSSVIIIVAVGFVALVIATFLNRMGQVNLAGFLVVATFMASPIANIATTPGGLNMMVLPLYSLLVLPLVCAVSFLPPWWVFVVALGNSIFTFISLIYLPQTAELNALLSINFAGIVTPIVLSQLIVSVVSFLWVRSTGQALMRADRAEELARLEHDLALEAEAAAQRKQQLEGSIQQIVETHRRIANGDYNVRVPLTSDNVLWPIAGSLNNLLARVQGWRQDLVELQQVKFALQQAREENRRLMKMLRG